MFYRGEFSVDGEWERAAYMLQCDRATATVRAENLPTD